MNNNNNNIRNIRVVEHNISSMRRLKHMNYYGTTFMNDTDLQILFSNFIVNHNDILSYPDKIFDIVID